MSLQRNVIANALGQGWVALMGVAFVPVYIHHLGIEAYGLVGVFAVLQTWLALLDLGFSLALNREVARASAGKQETAPLRDVIRSVECVGLGLAAGAFLMVVLAAPWLASDWLRAGRLSLGDVETALRLMGAVAAFRLLEGIYHGGVLGLQRQVAFSTAAAVLATLRWGGAALVVAVGPATIAAFFVWQAVVSAAAVAVYACMLYSALPRGLQPGRLSWSALRAVAPFATGILATTVLGLVVTQMDKVVLSRLLTLDAFGAYALAAFVAGAIQQLVLPIAQAYYPRLSQLAAAGEPRDLARAYHQGCQLAASLIVPAGILLIVFGEHCLRLWTGDAALAARTAPLLAVLAAASLLNGLMVLPYNLQLASGWSAFGAKVNALGALLFVPALLAVAPVLGAYGVAWTVLLLQAAYISIGMHCMYKRLLPREQVHWYLHDVLGPALACGGVIGALALGMPRGLPPLLEALWIVSAGAAGALATLAAAPELRASLRARRRVGAAQRG